jgi:hypothetical protein
MVMSHTEIRERDTLILTARAWFARHMDSLYGCPHEETERVIKSDEFVLLLSENFGSENNTCCFDAACFVLTVVMSVRPTIMQLNQLQYELEQSTSSPDQRSAEIRRLNNHQVPSPIMRFLRFLSGELRRHGASAVESQLVTSLVLSGMRAETPLTIDAILHTINQLNIRVNEIDTLCADLQEQYDRLRLDQLLWRGVTE